MATGLDLSGSSPFDRRRGRLGQPSLPTTGYGAHPAPSIPRLSLRDGGCYTRTANAASGDAAYNDAETTEILRQAQDDRLEKKGVRPHHRLFVVIVFGASSWRGNR